MLDVFKMKAFELDPIFETWNDCPMFTGNPKKDPAVNDWLKQVKEGCQARNVPKEVWHKAGQHFMGDKAKQRLNELKTVMAKVHGGHYRWNWEKFKIAMRNMGWNIDTSVTEPVKVQGRPSGIWWLPMGAKKTEEPESIDTSSTPQRPTLPSSRSDTLWLMRKNSSKGEAKSDKSDSNKELAVVPRPVPVKSKTIDVSFWPSLKGTSKDEKDLAVARPEHAKSKSDGSVPTRSVTKPDLPSKGNANDDSVTTVAHAPTWLLNACNALDFLTTEHPKVMTTISAVLITVGAIPAAVSAVPALSGSAGGAILASGAAHAVGAIATGVGNWLKAQADGQVQVSNMTVATVEGTTKVK
ncbi:hypothetical protein HGRIS_007033 [Hohenbuehelia grisea]|uniref:Uncharacterized protein n=1 Tax=Hohenbuehelia grisea TaxID=104357 RepID=A0ABR3JBK3_9AGAR